jgi:hypothetical protein
MAIYNIIYHSKGGESYLWNGSSFDKLGKQENTGLFFSGKAFDEDEVAEAIEYSVRAAREQFPRDCEPRIEKAEVPVNDGDTKGGHHQSMSS